MKVKQLDKMCHENEGDNLKSDSKISTISEQLSGSVMPFKDNKISKLKTDENDGSFFQSIKAMKEIYTNPVYVLISICMATYVIIFIPIITVTVDYSKDKGISESYGKYLINALAIGDLVGRLCFGWVTDRGFMTIPSFVTTLLVLQGIFIALFPITNSLYTFMTLQVLYGMASGSMLVLFPVLVLKYVDMNKQAVAIACVGFLSGLVSFCIPPLIGYFRDKVGSYDGMFYLTGGVSIISGGMWLLEPVVVKLYYGDDYQEKIDNKNYFKNIEGHEKEAKPS
ncbi:monocarboxylate transporter 12 [Parasteatoda tepidariorum]|uniref:monocarboxylate transporter 12 n=1 Tax=Parasteatoda tepidariorum TaxID=114398 RepID=UPI001C723101|nr:monocarboxylate transporter 12 [Parasteatoda tepidariorum]